MESPNSTESDKPVEPTVHPAPAVDTSQLFQKDPEPSNSITKRNLLSRLGKKRLIILAIVLVAILVGSGIALAQLNKSDKRLASQQAPEDNLGNTNSTEGSSDSNGGTADQSATSDDSSLSSDSTSSSNGGTSTTNTSTGGSAGTGGSSGETTSTSPKTYDISYTNSCYSPANVTIKKSDTVKFTNKSTLNMWPASNKHPKHEDYKEFDSDSNITPDGAYSFTFTKTGSWGYHDHNRPSCGGTITVQ